MSLCQNLKRKSDLEVEHLTLKNAWLRNKMEQEMNIVFEGDLCYRRL